jgi:hypothetical protein
MAFAAALSTQRYCNSVAGQHIVRNVAIASALALVCVASQPVSADDAKATDTKYLAKKDRERATKRMDYDAKLVPQPGRQARRLINLYNSWTDEWMAIDPTSFNDELRLPRLRKGFIVDQKPQPATFDSFLRCHFTNESTAMAPQLPLFLLSAALHFNVNVVEVVSAFRHPKYNLVLRKKGHQVARDSQHTFGHAVDFRLRGVTVQALHKWAVSKKLGGVGFYRESEFVHMDNGPIRYWNGE